MKWRIYQLLLQILQQLNRMEQKIMTAQDDINALVALATEQNAKLVVLATALAGIQSDIDTLVAGQVPGEPVDLTGLQAAIGDLVTQLDVQVAQAEAIDLQNPVIIPPPV